MKLKDLRFEPLTHIHVGAVESDSVSLLRDAGRQLHDLIVRELGPRRIGPVSWDWWDEPMAIAGVLEGLAAVDVDVVNVRAFLVDHPGACLVVASAPCLPGGVG